MRNALVTLAFAGALSSCAGVDALRTNLSSDPIPSVATETALLNALMEPLEATPNTKPVLYNFKNVTAGDEAKIKRYLNAGLTLTDIYCDRFFRQTNAAYRKRKFGRSATNDVGTAVATVLGLADAGPKAIAGIAAGFGVADSTWRNYDDSFVVSPQLATMRAIVTAAQDRFRQQTYEAMPKDYMTARSAIVRYSAICSFLGMQALLEQSVNQQRRDLTPTPTTTPAPAPAPAPAPPPKPTPTPTPTPDAQISVIPVS